MEFPVNPAQMVELLRSWFFASDRSIVLADSNRLFLGTSQLGPSGALTLISETQLDSSVATVTFAEISNIFRNLMLTLQVRTDRVSEIDNVDLRFNGDSGANYDSQTVRGRDVLAIGQNTIAGTEATVGLAEAANSRANNFSPSLITIFSYTKTDREKWIITSSTKFGDVSIGTDMDVRVRSLRWRNVSAITSISLMPRVGPNFVSGSIFQLYGIL